MQISRHTFLKLTGASALASTLLTAACTTNHIEPATSAQNGDKNSSSRNVPVVWFTREPHEVDKDGIAEDALSLPYRAYYVGVNAQQGAEVQTFMIKQYMSEHASELDKNNDGIISYVFAIGDSAHPVSIERTRGLRKIFGTAHYSGAGIDISPVDINLDGSSEHVQDSTIVIGKKTYTLREIASKEMKSADGQSWNKDLAAQAIQEWTQAFGDKIDMVVAQNDSMALTMFNAWSHTAQVPTFGYDAISEAVDALHDGFAGTVTQFANIQSYITLRLLRNVFDGVDSSKGISYSDEVGNILYDDLYNTTHSNCAFYVRNVPVTKANYKAFQDTQATYESIATPLDPDAHPKKRVLVTIHTVLDEFLSQTYVGLLNRYAQNLNLDLDIIYGDGEKDSSILEQMSDTSGYDGFAFNIIDSGAYHDYLKCIGIEEL